MELIASGLTAERGGRVLFRDLSFAAASGSLTWLAGPNGSGKTTLLRVLAGLAQPLAGTVQLGSEAEPGDSIHYLGHLDGLKTARTALANLEFWQRLAGAPARPAADALAAVGLSRLADVPAGYLSAGQRRRLAISRLLASHRPVWLLDEPTTALDAASEERFGALLAEHLSAGGLAIAASHGALPIAETARIELGQAA